MKKMIEKIGGWGNFLGLCILISVLFYGFLRRQKRINNPMYAVGISEGIKKGVRGSLYLHYYFKIDGVLYTWEVPAEFCKDCSDCCDVGDMVQVRYEEGNPTNNDLVISIPGE
jgi:hypothetical protein